MQQQLFDLTGKVALVTGAGANGGIGHAIALGFAQHGALFLCSAAAGAVTGVLLPVDGGNLALNAGGNHIWPTES